MQYAQGQQGLAYQQAGQPVGPRFSDPNAGLNLALQNQSNLANYNASIYGAQSGLAGAKAQAQGAMIGGGLSMLGSLAAAPMTGGTSLFGSFAKKIPGIG